MAHNLAGARRRFNRDTSGTVRILFISSTRIGDAVLSTGLLAHLLARHPGARITLACGPAAEQVFSRMPGLERLVGAAQAPIRPAHWLGLWRHAVTPALGPGGGSARLGHGLAGADPGARGDARRPAGRAIGWSHLGEVLGVAPPPLPVAWWNADDAAARPLTSRCAFLALGPTANWHAQGLARRALRGTGPGPDRPRRRAVRPWHRGPRRARRRGGRHGRPRAGGAAAVPVNLVGQLTLPRGRRPALPRRALYRQ